MKEFLDTVRKNLPDIQNEFDKYQEHNFPLRTPQFFCLELNGEAGELANLEKKIWKGKVIAPERLDDEAADTFIALINYCNSRKIDLASAVAKKLEWIDNKRIELNKNGEEF